MAELRATSYLCPIVKGSSSHSTLDASDSRRSISHGYKPSSENASSKSSKKRPRSPEDEVDHMANTEMNKLHRSRANTAVREACAC
jgi:hypothetical protein